MRVSCNKRPAVEAGLTQVPANLQNAIVLVVAQTLADSCRSVQKPLGVNLKSRPRWCRIEHNLVLERRYFDLAASGGFPVPLESGGSIQLFLAALIRAMTSVLLASAIVRILHVRDDHSDAAACIAPAPLNSAGSVTSMLTGYCHSIYFAQPNHRGMLVL